MFLLDPHSSRATLSPRAAATFSPVAGDAIVDVDEGRSPTLEIGQLEAKSFGDCVAQAISDGIV
jgi:hypothetical protein